MQSSIEAIYGVGRLVFGAALLAAPEALGNVLIGKAARKKAVRTMMRFYGTRDVVLGLGTLRAVAGNRSVDPWLSAGITSDVLDAAVMFREWESIPPDKRVPGVIAAVSAGTAGALLLARRPDGEPYS